MGIVLAGMLVSVGVARAADTSPLIWGSGNDSCGMWLTERQSQGEREVIVIWVTAYLSGLNVGLPRTSEHTGQVGDHLDNEGVIAWMDKHCGEHLLDTIQVAANKLYEDALLASQGDAADTQTQLPVGQSALGGLQGQLTRSQAETDEQKRLRAEDELQIEMLNAQLLSLRQRLARLVTALDASEAKAKANENQVIDLGERLNEALVSNVEAVKANKCPH